MRFRSLLLALIVVAAHPGSAAAHVEHRPQQYRWVEPPVGVAQTGDPAQGAVSVLTPGPEGTLPRSVASGDEQLFVLFPLAAFPAKSTVEVQARPLAPARLAPPPPGQVFDANAYELSLAGGPLPLQRPYDIALLYARAGRSIVMLDGGTWTIVPSRNSHATSRLTATVSTLGTFTVVADTAALERRSDGAGRDAGRGVPWNGIVLGALTLVGVLVGAARVQRRRR